MTFFKKWRQKSIYPHRYSKIFFDFWWSWIALWTAILGRLKIEKDVFILVSGDTGQGKSHFTGNFCFRYGRKEPNFVLYPEFANEYDKIRQEIREIKRSLRKNKDKDGDFPELELKKKELGKKLDGLFKKNKEKMMFVPKENFIVDPDEFAYKMIMKEGQVLWLDEARRVANRRKWYSKINNAVADRKNQNRKLFNVYFLCMPFEKEFDPVLASHLTLWIWVRRGVGEIYCKISGIKGGTGLNIQTILEREAKWLKENPKRTIVDPTIHPEYIGRIAFSKLKAGMNREYKELVKEKKATGDLTDEEKKKFGMKIEKKPKDIVLDAIEDIKNGKLKDRKSVWDSLNKIKEDDDKKLKMLNFYLGLEGWGTFNKLFSKDKLKDEVVIDW